MAESPAADAPTTPQPQSPSRKRSHSTCFRKELEEEAHDVLVALDDAHENFIELVRYYRRVVNTRCVREELKAISTIFFAPGVECKMCESSAGIERLDCWDVAEPDEDNQQYNGYVCEVFGHADDKPERCRSADEMQSVCAGPVFPVLVALLLRVRALSTKFSTRDNLKVSDLVRGLGEGFTDQVRTVQRLNERLAHVTSELQQLDGPE